MECFIVGKCKAKCINHFSKKRSGAQLPYRIASQYTVSEYEYVTQYEEKTPFREGGCHPAMIDPIYLNQILQNVDMYAHLWLLDTVKDVTANFSVLVAYSLMMKAWRLQRRKRKHVQTSSRLRHPWILSDSLQILHESFSHYSTVLP